MATEISDARVAEIEAAGVNDSPSWVGTCICETEEVLEIIARMRRAEAVVSRLPVTADNMPIYPDMPVWVISSLPANGTPVHPSDPPQVYSAYVEVLAANRLNGRPDEITLIIHVSKWLGGYFPLADVFATDEAARAELAKRSALAAAPGREAGKP